ncbi:MAG TPA: HupE/UreJ family protein, partial [Steroidobacteraceae bacterium]|nr:HupE/UreJ family protein [Steroidobacteraceae bacterium]
MNTSTASWSRHSWFRDVSMVFAIVTALCSITSAHAHAVGTSYLHIDPAGSDSEVAVRVELSIRDIEFAVGLDANGDGRITWGEVNSSTPALVTYIGRKFGLSRGGHQCALGDSDIALDQHTDELYAVLSTTAACGSNGALAVQSDLFFEIDDSHRTLLAVANDEQSGGDGAVSVLTSTTRHWSTAEPAGAWQDFARFVGQGAWHIWIGFDHLAFLMLLLLPLARATTLDEQPHIWPRVTSILKVVTAFTAA